MKKDTWRRREAVRAGGGQGREAATAVGVNRRGKNSE